MPNFIISMLPGAVNSFPAHSIDFSIEAEQPAEPLRVSLTMLGRVVDYAEGDTVTLDGVAYTVTCVSHDVNEGRDATTLTLRDGLYDLYRTTPTKNIVWMTAPERLIKQAYLANFAEPDLTELRTRVGTYFGTGGWKMSDIVRHCANIMGLSLSYQLPDFWVKQLSISRSESVLDFVRGALGPLQPRVTVHSGVLFVLPARTVGSAADIVVNTPVLSRSSSGLLAERYKRFRVWGGSAEFRTDKWEGKTLTLSGHSTYRFFMNDSVGFVTSHATSGTRRYYSTTSDAQSTVLTESIFAKDIFGNDAFLLFRQEWRYLRKVKLPINSMGDLESVLNTIADNNPDLSSAPAIPNEQDFYLDSCSRTVNVYDAYQPEWEQPLLLETHQATWKYLWWSSVEITRDDDVKNPPEPSEVPSDAASLGFPTGYQKTIEPTREGLPTDADIVGVWSTDAQYEVTRYRYEYDRSNATDVRGGLLLEVNSLTAGQLVPVYANMAINEEGAWVYTRPTYDTRVRPALNESPATASPDVAYPGKDLVGTINARIERYREVSRRTVEKSVTEVRMVLDELLWFDAQGNPNQGLSGITNYTASTQKELLPITSAPQTLVRKRAMQTYDETTGNGTRVVEVSYPLVVSWDDVRRVAQAIRAVNNQHVSIHTTMVELPGKWPINAMIFGGSLRLRGEAVPGRVVGGRYRFEGTGVATTQLMVQVER